MFKILSDMYLPPHVKIRLECNAPNPRSSPSYGSISKTVIIISITCAVIMPVSIKSYVAGTCVWTVGISALRMLMAWYRWFFTFIYVWKKAIIYSQTLKEWKKAPFSRKWLMKVGSYTILFSHRVTWCIPSTITYFAKGCFPLSHFSYARAVRT